MPARPIPQWLLQTLLLLALLLFLAGVSLPMLSITKFIVIGHSFSVLSGVVDLLRTGHLLLALLIAVFSLVLPLFKLVLLMRLSLGLRSPGPREQKWLRLMHDYGRWAMLDVMVVAVLVVSVKLGALATVQLHLGFYLFSLAVVLMLLLTQWITSALPGHERPSAPPH